MAPTFDELEIQAKKVIDPDFELSVEMTKRVGLTAEKNITKARTAEEKAIDSINKVGLDYYLSKPLLKNDLLILFNKLSSSEN